MAGLEAIRANVGRYLSEVITNPKVVHTKRKESMPENPLENKAEQLRLKIRKLRAAV